jgi:acetoacetyl-CoA synthetase
MEEHLIQSDMNKDDILMYYTTTGWMMWNWYVSSLAIGSAIVCYEGSPLVPHVNVLWDLVDRIGITILGTGAKWLSVLEDRAVRPGQTHSLATLRTILATGSPVRPQTFDFVYTDIKSSIQFGSITGGTDIIACFAGNNPSVPVCRGEIQSWHLGCAMDCWDEYGKSVYGESGELVCLKPFPSMPVYFLNDPDGVKYHKAYFDKYPGVWAHGDYCLVNPNTKGIWMLGRSDGTLNPGGVRFGSAEIYHVVEGFKEIQDSLCVGQKSNHSLEERVILFLKMAAGSSFGPDLIKQVQASIRNQLSARHVPAVILPIEDIPYTHSGKKVEVAVKKILAGEDVKDRGSYSNPDSLDLYYNIDLLKGF